MQQHLDHGERVHEETQESGQVAAMRELDHLVDGVVAHGRDTRDHEQNEIARRRHSPHVHETHAHVVAVVQAGHARERVGDEEGVQEDVDERERHYERDQNALAAAAAATRRPGRSRRR